MEIDWSATKVTMELALGTTFILTLTGIPLSYWISNSRSPWKGVLESIVTVPLVLPPTVLGFYLLILTSPNHVLGGYFDRSFGLRFPFTFTGVLIASVICNMPVAIRAFVSSFELLDRRLLEASQCLGQNRFQTFCRVTLPLCWPGLVGGMVLTFAHTVGEFGVIFMVGGNIPGVTRTLSIALYDDMQGLNYASAHATAALLFVTGFLSLLLIQRLSSLGARKR